jgi:hypothetical protein
METFFLACVFGFSLWGCVCASEYIFEWSMAIGAELSRSWGDYLRLVAIKDFPRQVGRPDSFYTAGVGCLSGACFFAIYFARHCDAWAPFGGSVAEFVGDSI